MSFIVHKVGQVPVPVTLFEMPSKRSQPFVAGSLLISGCSGFNQMTCYRDWALLFFCCDDKLHRAIDVMVALYAEAEGIFSCRAFRVNPYWPSLSCIRSWEREVAVGICFGIELECVEVYLFVITILWSPIETKVWIGVCFARYLFLACLNPSVLPTFASCNRGVEIYIGFALEGKLQIDIFVIVRLQRGEGLCSSIP